MFLTGILYLMTACNSRHSVSDSVLWLPSEKVAHTSELDYSEIVMTPTIELAVTELKNYWGGKPVKLSLSSVAGDRKREGFSADVAESLITLSGNSEVGLLYGVYWLLRNVDVLPNGKYEEEPAYGIRILNHWDNPDGTIERGYAGKSILNWDLSPDENEEVKRKYIEYARANASVGINGAVLNNVNASPKILSDEYLKKVSEIAEILRPCGMKVYLSVNFASPMALDSLPTADPLDREVVEWWTNKAKTIYDLIPDFGGFLVKANSEGQPGSMDFGRTHAEGANMLAKALKPYGGIVMWRSFVYSPSDDDRAKQAYLEFRPLDGSFDDNVIIQIKNGPIDFQPREPFSPLFGAMPSTDEMVEFQITQEYLGQSNHLAFLAPMWKEFFDRVPPTTVKGVAGVANIGDGKFWTAHPMAQANWYAFGRLAWNPDLSSETIAKEWVSNSLFKDREVPQNIVDNVVDMMLESRETVVDYMMPLGLHHIFAFGHHYGPEPWCDVPGAREDWLPRYYHKADSVGIGFERTAKGSDALSQYPEPYRTQYAGLETCPENLLLWFHHVPWNHVMKSGNTLWDELCFSYQKGVDRVSDYITIWQNAKPYVDGEIYDSVSERLNIQEKDARWWRDACLAYFGSFSGMPLPEGVGKPEKSLEDYKKIKLPIDNYTCPSAELLDSVR